MRHRLRSGDLVGLHPRYGSIYVFEVDAHRVWCDEVLIVISVEGSVVRTLLPSGIVGTLHESNLIRL